MPSDQARPSETMIELSDLSGPIGGRERLSGGLG